MGHTGIVEQKMRRAEMRPHALRKLLDRGAVADIGSYSDHVGTCGFQLTNRSIERRLIRIGKRQPDTFVGKQMRDCQTYAACRL